MNADKKNVMASDYPMIKNTKEVLRDFKDKIFLLKF